MHFIIIFLSLFLLWVFIKKFRNGDFGVIRQKHLLFWLIIGGVLFATLIGRTPALAGIFAGVAGALKLFGVQLLRNVPFLSRVIISNLGNAGKGVHHFRSRYITLRYQSDSKQVELEIVDGRFKARDINSLSTDERIAFEQEIAVDTKSSYLYRAYRLQQSFASSAYTGQSEQTDSAGMTSVQMDSQQAADVLGIPVDASVNEIRTAHKRLMQRLHPDKGGNAYLASFINQAKDELIKIQKQR